MPFLPVTPEEVRAAGREVPDFVYVCGDAYVDHPSFGAAIITRVLEDAGFLCAVLAQPDWKTVDDFKKFGRPRLGFLVSSGNIDSMVAHYTAAKKKRSDDYYSPGGKAGHRPDRALIVYCNRIREAYGDVPILIGGLEASLRRFAHYDYWSNSVRRSILIDSRADILMYGMGEKTVTRLATLLDRGVPVKKIRDVRGTAYLCKAGELEVHFPTADAGDVLCDGVRGYDYDTLKSDKAAYAEAFRTQYRNNDSVHGRAIVEYYDGRALVVNPPMEPLEREELDRVYALPYMRDYHPMYEKDGGVPAIKEVKFSITHNRGCFGGCNFCALAFHQGRAVRSRSIESCVAEAEKIAAMPDFKGYIHDVGGPTANFRYPACKKQLTDGVCPDRRCLVPKPCPNLIADESEYAELLERIEAVKGVKKVFVRSGIRFDYMLCDKSDAFFRRLVTHHVSGQLKVAPEHCSPNVLGKMGKPTVETYDRFREKFFRLSEEAGLEQYLVPYLMSSHPGSTMDDAASLALYTKKIGLAPEQVQDFYPTPGTASTVMFYTGIDPFTKKKVYTPTDYNEKMLQRALLQWRRPENRKKIKEAEKYCSDEGKKMLRSLAGGRPPEKTKTDGRPAAKGKNTRKGGRKR
ncbi:MAG: YgiQ family radical SAM protein [Clostridia bacterium]|nr:YgiQ family radical SAM protein [Clostridia bacterium]